MAKKENSKQNNYKIERVRTPMSRDELNKLYNEFKSDDDYLNYHIETIEDIHPKYKITIINDDSKSPIKDDENDRSYGFMEKHTALEFLEDCVNNSRVSSKPKAVMQNGFSKKAIDKYKKTIEKEESECEIVNEFTKPTFDQVMNDIYVNVYNGETYNMKDNEIPDDLREDVGVIIPGVIENKEEYFDFVKRLKDRGKNGLGRSIYDKYEDYEQAKELIETYKQALYDKYGGKEEYFDAKDMGGMFGAYEYYPTVKPRFKKTLRNIKMDKGINLNELALVKDMGKRIREEYDEEIEQIEVDGYEYTMYENTPPKFKDLPEDLQMFYKTDKNNINGFTHTNMFTSYRDYAEKLIRSSDPEDQIKGYKIKEELENELLVGREIYQSEFANVGDMDEMDIHSVIAQLEYDRLMYENGNDKMVVDNIVNDAEIKKGFEKYLRQQLIDINGFDMEKPLDKNTVNELVKYGTKYVYSNEFKRDEMDKSNMNSVAEGLYTNTKNISFGEGRDYRTKTRNGDNKITTYVREIAASAKESLQNMNSNADNVNLSSTVSVGDIVGDTTVDKNIDGFYLDPTKASELLTYMKDNENLAKKIYELSSDTVGTDMFSERTNIDDFVSEAKNTSKPMITKNLIEKAMKSNRKGD